MAVTGKGGTASFHFILRLDPNLLVGRGVTGLGWDDKARSLLRGEVRGPFSGWDKLELGVGRAGSGTGVLVKRVRAPLPGTGELGTGVRRPLALRTRTGVLITG